MLAEHGGIPKPPGKIDGVLGRGTMQAVSDYQKALPGSIARWMPPSFTVLGTDGFGRSDMRSQLRKHFEVNRYYVALAALQALAEEKAVDAALVNGPGLRWSVLGAHMAYHLGGGTGGLQAYLEHLGPSQERLLSSLGSPSLTPEVCRKLVEGVQQEARGRGIPSLEQSRDAALIAALKARHATPVV